MASMVLRNGEALPPRVSGGVASSLPCLSSNNGNEGHSEPDEVRAFESLPDEVVAPEIREKINLLQSNHKKTAALLSWTIFTLAVKYYQDALAVSGASDKAKQSADSELQQISNNQEKQTQ